MTALCGAARGRHAGGATRPHRAARAADCAPTPHHDSTGACGVTSTRAGGTAAVTDGGDAAVAHGPLGRHADAGGPQRCVPVDEQTEPGRRTQRHRDLTDPGEEVAPIGHDAIAADLASRRVDGRERLAGAFDLVGGGYGHGELIARRPSVRKVSFLI